MCTFQNKLPIIQNTIKKIHKNHTNKHEFIYISVKLQQQLTKCCTENHGSDTKWTGSSIFLNNEAIENVHIERIDIAGNC